LHVPREKQQKTDLVVLAPELSRDGEGRSEDANGSAANESPPIHH
jgi:hypothetical protein